MLPSAFLSDLEVGNKTFVGMFKLSKGEHIQWIINNHKLKFRSKRGLEYTVERE